MSKMQNGITGGCACGASRYVLSSAPLHSMICHCKSCRKSAASPVVAWITFKADHYRIKGEEIGVFQSSEKVKRTFCKHCGTPLTYAHDERPGEIDITTCSLDDPDQYPPLNHSWLSHDLEWVIFADLLPKYKKFSVDS